MPQNDTWINDQSGANVPTEALLFINEEDWIKYKHARNNPSLPGKWKLRKSVLVGGNAPATLHIYHIYQV